MRSPLQGGSGICRILKGPADAAVWLRAATTFCTPTAAWSTRAHIVFCTIAAARHEGAEAILGEIAAELDEFLQGTPGLLA